MCYIKELEGRIIKIISINNLSKDIILVLDKRDTYKINNVIDGDDVISIDITKGKLKDIIGSPIISFEKNIRPNESEKDN